MPHFHVRSPGLSAIGGFLITYTLVAGPIGVREGFVGSFPPQTLDDLNHNWLVSGSAVSIPSAPLVALAVFVGLAQLRSRVARILGRVGCALLGCLFVFATFGEETFLAPRVPLEFALQLGTLGIALVLGVAGAMTAHAASASAPRRSRMRTFCFLELE